MMHDKNFVFSFELVIHKLFIRHNIPCRFPAAVFKLFDFPNILINHVEPAVGEAIRTEMSLKRKFDIPMQIPDLRDNYGNFLVKKGKSCLFKMSINTFKKYLTNIPLYIMVIDTFHEKSNLVGNCKIPLYSLVDAIDNNEACLDQMLSSMHGNKGTITVFNLMGIEIGYLILAFKFISYGETLIQHLSDLNMQNEKSNGEIVEKNRLVINSRDKDSAKNSKKCDLSVQTVDYAASCVSNKSNTEAPNSNTVIIAQSKDNRCFFSSSTQTNKSKMCNFKCPERNTMQLYNFAENHMSDDTFHPPPLFYCRESMPHIEIVDDLGSSTCESFIASDICSVIDEDNMENQTLLPSKLIHYKNHDLYSNGQSCVFSATNNLKNRSKDMNLRQKKLKDEKCSDLHISPQQGSFPLLSVLVKELLQINVLKNILQEDQSADNPSRLSYKGHAGVKPSLFRHVHNSSKYRKKGDMCTDQGGSSQQIITNWNACKRHTTCADCYCSVPKNKSWLGVVPTHRKPQKKSNLVYGLTNTQRLRLQKTNPEWLHTMVGDSNPNKARNNAEQNGRYQTQFDHLKSKASFNPLKKIINKTEESIQENKLLNSYDKNEHKTRKKTNSSPLLLNDCCTEIERETNIPSKQIRQKRSEQVWHITEQPNKDSMSAICQNNLIGKISAPNLALGMFFFITGVQLYCCM